MTEKWEITYCKVDAAGLQACDDKTGNLIVKKAVTSERKMRNFEWES